MRKGLKMCKLVFFYVQVFDSGCAKRFYFEFFEEKLSKNNCFFGRSFFVSRCVNLYLTTSSSVSGNWVHRSSSYLSGDLFLLTFELKKCFFSGNKLFRVKIITLKIRCYLYCFISLQYI